MLNLSELILKQLNNFFINDSRDELIIKNEIATVIEKCRIMFSHVNDKYYIDGNINFYNSSQYASFLYIASKHIWMQYGNQELCDKLFYLNKIMNGVDLFYDIDLPQIFYLEHPMGSILGRAKYGNFLSISQGVTVGKNKNKKPELGNYVTLYPNSTIIGECKIGNNVIVSTGTLIKDEIIPDNSIVFGSSPNLTIKQKKTEEIKKIISDRWRF